MRLTTLPKHVTIVWDPNPPVSLQNDIEEYALTRSKRHLDDNDIEEAKAQLYSQVDAIFDHLIECTASEIPLDECRTVAIRQGDRSYRDRDDDNTAMTMQSRYPDRDGGSPDPYGGHGNANRDNDRYNSKDERYLDRHDDGDCEDFYRSSDECGNDDDPDSECDGPECSGLGRSGGSYPDNYGRSGSEGFEGRGGSYPRNNGGSTYGGFGGNGDSYHDNKPGDEDCEDFYK
ncbi:unnamed protein product, partial [Hymenolepis diminuta]|uniref:Keratin, type I cytoskeletal 9-like n=1 Tax=Hymenolepis diminuta TaxID=6216 RepID=A0A0R3SVZ1_HYMDI